MAKTTTENKDLNSKNLSTPKDGFIQKKKSQKFKQTPTGKISLINGSKASNNNNNMKKQQLEKQKNSSPQKLSEKNKELKKENLSKTKKKSNKKSPKKSKANSPSSDEDINEGVVLKKQELMEETDDTESEEESEYEDEQEKSVPNILGTSLADDTEEDDEEFTVEDKKGKVQANKGVKMFKGLKSSNKSNDSLKSSDGSSMGSSMMDNSDEDEDEDDYEVDIDVRKNIDLEESEDEEVEEEEEEEDDDEDEGAESALGIKALLGNSIADDDDDDEDFVEPEGNDEDDDISDEDEEEEAGEGNSSLENSYQDKNNKDADSSLESMKADDKTIFVGNLPKDITKKQLEKLFKKFGKIDSIRIRGIVAKNMNMPKKVAIITKNVHPKLKSIYAYIHFASEESATAAVALNGTLFEGNFLRVDLANKAEKKYDGKKSVFLGNLSFKIDENTIRKHFENCGEIESVRVVKDNKTGLGKGFGYVNFMTEDAVALAFELDGTTILNRNVVVKPYVGDYQSKHRKRSHSSGSDKEHSPRKQLKQNSGKPSPTHNRKNTKKGEKEHKDKKQFSPQQTNTFQGQKADRNKKKKESNLEKKKKILAKKLTAKPKKPTN